MTTGRAPRRIQRKRTKGWRAPEHARFVGRPTVLGNPYRIDAPHPDTGEPMTAQDCVELYRARIDANPRLREKARALLRGRDVICWCDEDAEWCHGDVLLEVANR